MEDIVTLPIMEMTSTNMEAGRTRKEQERRKVAKLIPSIPNDITIEVISPMLPWETFHALSSVSHAWKEVVQSRKIHDARIRTQSTDTLVVINHCLSRLTNDIALYCLRGAFYDLPPIQQVGIPRSCSCTTFNGKIYILGGLKLGTDTLGSKEVYVLDLAGLRKWEKCANMLQGRYSFGCGVLDGKIYVCGGLSRNAHVSGSEVYDPKIDSWRSIEPMTSLLADHEVGVVGDEVFVFGGRCVPPKPPPGIRVRFGPDNQLHLSSDAKYQFQAYNRAQDRWRTLSEHTGLHLGYYPGGRPEKLFVAQGKLHSMTENAIFIYNLETNTRKLLHSYSVEGIVESRILDRVMAVDDQLLAIFIFGNSMTLSPVDAQLYQSRGFNTNVGNLVLRKKVECPLKYFNRRYFPSQESMLPLRL